MADGELRVRIVRRPAGEAPEAVRDAWVGLDLAVMGTGPRRFLGDGVLTVGRNAGAFLWRLATGRLFFVRGYAVRYDEAVGRLRESDGAAARWWDGNASDRLKGSYLIFEEADCEEMPRAGGGTAGRP